MTPAQALAVLDIVTNPANVGKLNRADYANAEAALRVLSLALNPQSNIAPVVALETKKE